MGRQGLPQSLFWLRSKDISTGFVFTDAFCGAARQCLSRGSFLQSQEHTAPPDSFPRLLASWRSIMQTTSCQLSQGCWLSVLASPRNQIPARFPFHFCQPGTGTAASSGLGGGGAGMGLSWCSLPARLQPPPAAPQAIPAPSHPLWPCYRELDMFMASEGQAASPCLSSAPSLPYPRCWPGFKPDQAVGEHRFCSAHQSPGCISPKRCQGALQGPGHSPVGSE